MTDIDKPEEMTIDEAVATIEGVQHLSEFARITTYQRVLNAYKPAEAPATAPDMITRLMPGQIIVVGTNIQGLHGAGAARYAYDHFGLRWRVGEGLSGQAYALPTMEGPAALRKAVARFITYAELSNDLTFLLTKVGCGIAGYSEDEVSWMFAGAPVNVLRPAGWPVQEAKP